MEPNKNEITFEIMVMYSEVLEKAIEQHNKYNGTDFRITEIIDDEVISCKITVSKYQTSDLFNLGHRLSVIEHKMRENGELDW